MLLLIALLVGGVVWWRARRGRLRGLPGSTENGFGFQYTNANTEEEAIPLTQSRMDDDEDADVRRTAKGKERAVELDAKEEIFRVDDSDDEDHEHDRGAGLGSTPL